MPDEFEIDDFCTRAYKQIIKFYLRYTMIRSAEFTDSSIEAEQITFYTLLTACLALSRLKHTRQLGELFEDIIRKIADDLHKEHTGRQKCEKLFTDPKIKKLARAINTLDSFTMQVLVLCHIEMMTTKQISGLYNKSISDIRFTMRQGGKKLVALLDSSNWSDSRQKLLAEDVPLWLDELDDAIDSRQRHRIAERVLNYLNQPPEIDTRIQKYLRWFCRRENTDT